MTSPHGKFNFASCARAAHLWETSCHTMSDRNAHPSLTLRDREGQVVYQPSSINAGNDVSDSDSGSVVSRNAANRERSSSPEVVQIRYLFQPPRPPRQPPQPPPPSLPMPVLPAWDKWAKAQPFRLRSRTNKPPPPPSQSFRASTCRARPQLMKTPSVPAKQHRPCDRVKKLQRKEKCNSAVAHCSSLTDKKALWKKRLLSQPKADARTVVAPAVKRRKEKACRISTGVPVVAGARAHRSEKKAKLRCVKSLEPLTLMSLHRQPLLSVSLRLQCLQYPLH